MDLVDLEIKTINSVTIIFSCYRAPNQNLFSFFVSDFIGKFAGVNATYWSSILCDDSNLYLLKLYVDASAAVFYDLLPLILWFQ